MKSDEPVYTYYCSCTWASAFKLSSAILDAINWFAYLLFEELCLIEGNKLMFFLMRLVSTKSFFNFLKFMEARYCFIELRIFSFSLSIFKFIAN